ncbi:MAG: hypothetical protein HeimC2_29600 [Candidatus Heimdallarchaeota archaeon LC_2]|nr:MAG: hypothetical protein HeimC2_29600 [Candidatus Heimdallarchaeota archaeon LC_2]
MVNCGVCYVKLDDFDEMASHFLQLSDKSDPSHIKFLNQYISSKKLEVNQLRNTLEQFFNHKADGLHLWIKKVFVQKFYSNDPHPFVLALQHPSNSTLIGYTIEHQHFLRQWVRSCGAVISKTDKMDVTLYELENINTEFGGFGTELPSHFELLIRMGESLGISRKLIFETQPLQDTARAIKFWQEIAQNRDWIETMTAMHSLELIAYRNIKNYGASISYFDPGILDQSEISDDTKQFLREGYEADITHADEALELIEKYANNPEIIQRVQATFLQSIEWFDRYLLARLDRGKEFE